jgi:nicotinate-nucleotide adenylyltransferase
MGGLKTGIFGGTFDPPHIAHLILAGEALHQLGLDRLLWVLTPFPPHKQGRDILPLHTRLELLSAALRSEPAFELSRVDIDRHPPHYALDTMTILREAYPRDELVYLMGGDSLHDLPEWRQPQQFVAACSALGVMRRPGDQVDLSVLEAHIPGITSKVIFIEAPLLEISATDLRQRIAQDRPYRYFLPESVYEIICAQDLYKSPS